MTFTAEQIVDRRRLRRKLSFWRVAAFVAVAIAIVAAAAVVATGGTFPGLVENQIARVDVSGFITDDREQIELLDRLGESEGVKGVIVAIDSTGGASAGGEALYEGLRRLAAKKPTVAVIGTVGASAAYMAAIATDHIVARRTTITGSIGVLFQYPEVSGLLDKIGVKVEDISSGPLKAQPSPFKPASPEAKAVIAGLIGDIYRWFVAIVAERRGLDQTQATLLADGRIFTGQQALAAKLIDEIGGEREAIAWLEQKGVAADLPVRDWKPKRRDGGWFSTAALAFWFARQVGLSDDALGRGALDHFLPERLKLDGLVSVWQAPAGLPQEGAGGAIK
jgi:protease-4